MDIKGLSIQDIIDMDWKNINKLNVQELKQLSMRLNSAANKRLRRLEKSGMDEWSPAYQHIKRSGGDFSVKGKDTKVSIKNEIQRASDFLRSKTSTDKGSKEYRENVSDIFRSKGNKKKKKEETASETETPQTPDVETPDVDLDDEDLEIDDISEMQRKKLFRALDRLREQNSAAVFNIGSDVIIRELRRAQLGDKRKSRDRLVEELEKKYPELMEDAEARYVREQQDYENRIGSDGEFHELTSDSDIPDAFRE